MGTNKNGWGMSRFVQIPTHSGGVKLINTDHIREVVFHPRDGEKPCVLLKNVQYQEFAEFDTPEEARDFLEKNFILFNS